MSRKYFQLLRGNGEVVNAIETTSAPIRTTSLDDVDTHSFVPGDTVIRLEDGHRLKPLPDGTFEIADTGEILTRL